LFLRILFYDTTLAKKKQRDEKGHQKQNHARTGLGLRLFRGGSNMRPLCKRIMPGISNKNAKN